MSERKAVERRRESRNIIRKMLDTAFGLYIGEEPKKGDSWRDQDYGKLYSHLAHELQEIKRSKTTERQFHNCLDACVLAAILAGKVVLREAEHGKTI